MICVRHGNRVSVLADWHILKQAEARKGIEIIAAFLNPLTVRIIEHHTQSHSTLNQNVNIAEQEHCSFRKTKQNPDAIEQDLHFLHRMLESIHSIHSIPKHPYRLS